MKHFRTLSTSIAVFIIALVLGGCGDANQSSIVTLLGAQNSFTASVGSGGVPPSVPIMFFAIYAQNPYTTIEFEESAITDTSLEGIFPLDGVSVKLAFQYAGFTQSELDTSNLSINGSAYVPLSQLPLIANTTTNSDGQVVIIFVPSQSIDTSVARSMSLVITATLADGVSATSVTTYTISDSTQ